MIKELPPYETRHDPDPAYDYMPEYLQAESEFNYRRMLSWLDCEHLQTESKKIERMNMEKKYGKNSAIVRSMLYGMFQRSEDFNLIYTEDDIEKMKQAMRGDFTPIGNDVRAAGDISGGGDGQILDLRIGTEIVKHDDHSCGIDIDQADYWVRMLQDLEIAPWKFAMDSAGLGATVANYMEKRLFYSGINRIQANVGPQFKFEFRDKYTEIHFRIKELLSAEVLKLPYNEKLLKQMRCRRFIEMESGHKLKTEDKKSHRKREKCSPDELDTLVYVFWDFDWSILDIYKELKKGRNEDPLTEMEQQAREGMRKSGGAFGGLRDMGDFRRDFHSQGARIKQMSKKRR